MNPSVIVKKRTDTGIVLRLSLNMHDTSVGVRHFDRTGKLHVVTMLSLGELGALTLGERALFGDTPITLSPNKFRQWMDKYNASNTTGLQRYFCLKEVGIPFTRHQNAPLLFEDKHSGLRSSVADMILKFDLEDAEALLNVGKAKGVKQDDAKQEVGNFIDLSEYGGRWLRKRWFVFENLEDAALAKLKFATNNVQALLVEL